MRRSNQPLYAVGGLLGAAVVALILLMTSGAQVDAGHVGVVATFGAIDSGQRALDPGFHVVMPVVTHITSVSTQPQNHTFREVVAASKELQNVYVDGGVNYHIDTGRAAQIQIQGGEAATVLKVFDPAFQDYIKEVVPQYGTTELLNRRQQIRDSVKQRLAEKAGPYGLTVDDVFLTNIHFDEDFAKAIEQKQVASQQLEQAKIEAQTRVTQAQGEADANRIRQQSLSPELIDYTMIQKWDGKLPQATAGNPFVQLQPPR